MFFLQKIVSYFKIWFTMLKTFSKASLLLYSLLLLLLVALKFLIPQHISLISLGEDLILSIFLGKIFLDLKKNNFFQFLYFNRNGLPLSIEILFFLSPIILVLSIYDTQWLISGQTQIKNYSPSVLIVFEMLCMTMCWLKKYIFAHILIMILNPEDLIRMFASQHLNKDSIMHLANNRTTLKYCISSIIIELLFVVYTIKQQQKINIRK